MKAFGRLLLATALLVPAGLMTAQSAGAASKNTATCSGNKGTLHLSPGVRSTDAAGQVITNYASGTIRHPTDPGRLTGCKGVGIAGSTGGDFSFSLSGSGGVTCSSIRGRTFVGTGQIKWDADGSNAHIVSQLRLQLKFNTYTQATFTGKVDSTYLKNTRISGTAAVPDSLKLVGDGGGKCQNKKRVKALAYKQSSPTKL